MLSWFKKNEPVPAWAPGFNQAQYKVFSTAIKEYFDNKNLPITIEDGVIHPGENKWRLTNLGLTNLMQVCQQYSPTDYKVIVESHFDAMIRSREFEEEFDNMLPDFQKVKDFLAVRIYPVSHVDRLGKENIIYRDLGGDIMAMVVFDLPDTITNITTKQAAPWNKTHEEIWNIALDNTHRKNPVQLIQKNLDDISVHAVTADHFFTGTTLLLLENHPAFNGTYGTLAGLPHRHTIWVYPVNDLQVVKAINSLTPIVARMYDEGPGSLSNQLYWIRNGVWTHIDVKTEDDRVIITPPSQMVEWLNEMGE